MAVNRKAAAQAGLLVIAAVLIVLGAARGEAGLVLSKAIKICLECVGIG